MIVAAVPTLVLYWIAAAVAVVVVAGGVWFMRFAGTRGWVYNKQNPRPSGTGIPSFVDGIFQPNIEHVVDEQTSQQTRADLSESGDGSGRDADVGD